MLVKITYIFLSSRFLIVCKAGWSAFFWSKGQALLIEYAVGIEFDLCLKGVLVKKLVPIYKIIVWFHHPKKGSRS